MFALYEAEPRALGVDVYSCVADGRRRRLAPK